MHFPTNRPGRRAPTPPVVQPARPLDAAGRARVEQHLAMAYRLAWIYARFHARGMPAEDLFAEALFGLTYAASLYREDRQVPFGGYATLVIRHRLTRAVRQWKRDKRVRPMPRRTRAADEPWEPADGRPAADAADGAAVREQCERVRQVLPARLYQFLHLYHVEGYTLDQIGRQAGITRQRVRQLINLAERQARVRLAKAAGRLPSDE